MPGIVKGKDFIVFQDLRIIQDMPELPAIGSRRMQANQGNAALPGLFKINPAVVVHDPDGHVAANDRLDLVQSGGGRPLRQA